MNSIPQDWRWESLDDLSVGGLFTDGDWVESKDQDPEGRVRLTQLADVGEGQFRDRSNRWLNEEQAGRLAVTRLQPRDLLIARMPDPLARCCSVPDGIGDAITVVDVAILRITRQDLFPPYVMWAINGPAFNSKAKAQASGTTRLRISRRKLGALTIPVPPLDEQRRIVATLEDLLSRLEAGYRSISAASMRLTPLKRSGLARTVTSVDTQQRELRSVVERVEAGKSFTCIPRPSQDDEWGIIKVSAMTWGEFRPAENKTVPAGQVVDERHAIRAGDILVSRANTEAYVGAPVRVTVDPHKLLLSDKSLRLVPRAGVDPAWLLTVLQAPATRKQVSALSTGTKESMRNISQQALLSVTVPVPTDPRDQDVVIERGNAVLDSARELSRSSLIAEARVRTLRRSLLNAAIEGRLVPRGREEAHV